MRQKKENLFPIFSRYRLHYKYSTTKWFKLIPTIVNNIINKPIYFQQNDNPLQECTISESIEICNHGNI